MIEVPETFVIFTFSGAGAPVGWGQDRGVGVRCGIGALDGEIKGDMFTVNRNAWISMWLYGCCAEARTTC
jgi:hypothetical protein